MTATSAEKPSLWPVAVLALAMVATLVAVGRRLYAIQVRGSGEFDSQRARQSVRRVHMPATRGRIFDADGVCMADNRPSYCIAFYVEEMRRPGHWTNTIEAVDRRVNDLSLRLGIPRQISRRDIERHVMRRLPLPLLAWRDIDARTLAKFSETWEPSSGTDIYVQPERVYPLGKAGAHLLGFVGRAEPQAPTNEASHYNIMGMKGRAGVEAARDDDLAGQPGGKLITVDVSGYRHSETNRPPVPGRDVRLTVLSRLQILCERVAGDRRAAIVAVDPRDGSILALASEPAYDPNAMSPAVPGYLWRSFLEDDNRPLLNRAIAGLYPPGSTFKPCVALAALENGVDPGFAVDCDGVYRLGKMQLRCAARYGHGRLGLRKALEVSCNPYFCNLGVHAGLPAITATAARLGFGRKTGIGLSGELSGLLPDDAWKRVNRGSPWRQGDTANLSIGQSFLLATPLQLAMYVAALANGGTLYRPRLYADEAPAVIRECGFAERNLRLVRQGMFDVVNGEKGGGRKARIGGGITVAAKTGTAEYGPRANRRKHTWMVAYAPFEKPEIAAAVLVEDGESGGKTAAPIVASLFCAYFGVPPAEEEPEEQEAAQEGEEQPAAEAAAEPLPDAPVPPVTPVPPVAPVAPDEAPPAAPAAEGGPNED